MAYGQRFYFSFASSLAPACPPPVPHPPPPPAPPFTPFALLHRGENATGHAALLPNASKLAAPSKGEHASKAELARRAGVAERALRRAEDALASLESSLGRKSETAKHALLPSKL